MQKNFIAILALSLLATSSLFAVDVPKGTALYSAAEQDVAELKGEETELTTVASGTFKKYRFKGSDNSVSTTSSTMVTLPNMNTSVTLASTDNVLVTFCGMCTISGPVESNFPVQLLVDGSPHGNYRYMYENEGTAYWQSSCTQWFVKGLSSGSHDFEVQWSADNTDEIAYCDDRSIFLQYRQ